MNAAFSTPSGMRFGPVQLLSYLLLSLSTAVSANAADACYQWATDGIQWRDSPQGALDQYTAYCNSSIEAMLSCGLNLNYGYCTSIGTAQNQCTYQGTLTAGTWPAYTVNNAVTSHLHGSCSGSPCDTTSSRTWPLVTRVNPNGCGAFVSALFAPPAQCGPTCNGVAEPINPISGATYDTMVDMSGIPQSFGFKRFYNSTDSGNPAISGGWRYGFSRSITIQYSTIKTQPYVQSASNSSLYTTPNAACANGFAEIQSLVSSWAGATALYSNGACQLSKGGTSIGSVPVYTQAGGLAPAPTPIAYDVTRDDGQVIRFLINGTSIVTPPSINVKLQQTASGFVLTDANDNVETYDTIGKLFSVTSRSGVVQTMSYDSSGRLSGVIDNFGHQLTLGYDAQNKLISVTRQ